MRAAVLCVLLGAAFALDEEHPKLKHARKFNLKGKSHNANPEVSIAHPRQRTGTTSDTTMGLNVPAWMDKSFMEEYGNKAINSSFNSMRFPGGSWANKYIWNFDYKEFPYFENMTHHGPDKLDTKQVVELAKATNSKLMIQVNYAVARVYGAEKAGKLAADWVQYIRQNLSYPLAFVEVGNENYGKWEVPFSGGPQHHKVNGKLYGEDFNVIQKHIHAVDSSIQVGAVLSINEGHAALDANEISGEWNADVMSACGKNADFVSTHVYFPEGPPSALFQFAGAPKAMRTEIDTLVKKYTNRKRKMPIALTEFNLQMSTRNQTINMADGLFLARLLGECMEHDIFMTQLWALRTKWIGRGSHNKDIMMGKFKHTEHVRARGGEYGIFSANQPGVARHTTRSTLYTEFIYKRIFSDGRHLVKSTSAADDLMVFAAGKEDNDASVGMVLVNLGAQEKSVTLAGFPETDKAKMWTFEGESNGPNDKRFMLNKVQNSNSTSQFGGPWPLETIPAMSVSSKEKITVPPYSVVGILAE